MNRVFTFYRWLTAPEYFGFISAHSPDECASLLEGAANTRPRLLILGWLITVDVTSISADSYAFAIKLKHFSWLLWSGYRLEANGTITPFEAVYSRVEGAARTRASVAGILVIFLPVAVFLVWVAFLFQLGTTTKDQPLALLGALVLILLLIGFLALQMLMQKWAYARFADSVVALLVRTV
jgi:hypothetical protein